MSKRGEDLQRYTALPTLYAIRTKIRAEAERLPWDKPAKGLHRSQLTYRADAVDDAIMQLGALDLEGLACKLRVALDWFRADAVPGEWPARIVQSLSDDLPMLDGKHRRLEGFEFRALLARTGELA